MPPDPFLHERSDFADLIRIVADERGLLPALVEKDYWIMHCLYGLAAQGFAFELKGGTSLSKGFGIIQRFSEDIDIRIDPVCAPFEVFTGANQTKKARHIESRQKFYDWLADTIQIRGISNIERDHAFDDEKFRSGGIRLHYDSIGTPEYQEQKKVRFRTGDNLNISENEAFLLSDPATRDQYALAYQATASLYFSDQIPFDTILDRVQTHIEAL
jgi:hypothetical protein